MGALTSPGPSAEVPREPPPRACERDDRLTDDRACWGQSCQLGPALRRQAWPGPGEGEAAVGGLPWPGIPLQPEGMW